MRGSSIAPFAFRSLLGLALLAVSWACGDTSTGPTLEITTALLPDAAQATAYDHSLEATGETGDLTWSIRSGYFLPTGLSLSADGRITGVPTDSLSTWLFAVDVASTDGGTDFEFLRITTVPLTLRATGIVDQVEAPLALAVGDTFTVTYSVDMGAPDSDAVAERGRYLAAQSVRVQIGSYTCTVDLRLVSADHTVSVLDDTGTVPYDEYGLILFEQLVSTGQEGSLLGCPQLSGWNANNQTELAILSDASATAFENDALPRGPLYLPDFDYARLSFEFYNPSNCSLGQCSSRSVGAPLQSLTVVPVE